MKRSLPFWRLAALLLLWGGTAHGQGLCPDLPPLRGLKVYGGTDERALPVIRASSSRAALPDFITIRFDVNTESPPRFRISFRHCDKEWNPDRNFVVEDDFYSYSRMLSWQAAPAGTVHYRWRFENRFPSPENPFVRFLFSGNWTFSISLESSPKDVLASGRFFVVEDAVGARLQVLNDYWTDYEPPSDRVHHLRLTVTVPDSLFADFVTTVDLYKNLEMANPYRVSQTDWRSDTRVEGVGMRVKTFSVLDVIPGNGYRIMDFRDLARYPTVLPVRKFEGPDQTRFRFGTDPSRFFGASLTDGTSGWDSDYLCVTFELSLPPVVTSDIFLAGSFNDWDPGPADRMVQDSATGHYMLSRFLQRGAYEYQYVAGRIDAESGRVVDQDWVKWEGSDWGADNLYWAIVYYDDDQYGGVTRAVGFVRKRSQ